MRFDARLFGMVLLVALGACVTSPRPGMGDVRTERVDRTFELGAEITRVAIDNPWGMLNVRARDEREVGLHAVVQSRSPRFANATFRSRRDGDTLHVDLGFDGATPDAATAPGRIDAAIYLPAELALKLVTRDGPIGAKKRVGAIEASSDSGQIRASSYDRLTLRTRSGLIRAAAIGRRWDGASTIESESGRIVLLVSTFGDIDLDARTGGSLRTGFGLSVRALDGGGHGAHARYGAGNSPLRVRSASGEIVLEQLVLLGEDTKLPGDDD